MLILTFANHLRYKRGEASRTPSMTLPFKVLGDFFSGEMEWRASADKTANTYVIVIAI